MNKKLHNKINNMITTTKATHISTKVLYEGNFITLMEEQYLLPNQVIMKRERITKNQNKQAVIIIAITKEDKYLLVAQNRINNMTTLEFPSGYIEPNESIIEASARELLEETGYTSYDIKPIDSYCAQPSIDSGIVHIVIAYNCLKTNDQTLGKYEYINYDEFTLAELKALIDSDYINGAGNKLAFYELLKSIEKK